MGIFQRVKDAGRALFGERAKTFRVGLRSALSHGLPGAWASNHSAEVAHVKDWMYIAIRAIALQAAKAELQVYRDETNATKSRRKSLSKQARTDSLLRKSMYSGEQEIGEPLDNSHRVMRLYKRPNPSQSGALFRYECVLNLQATGSCLIWNVPRKLDGATCERCIIPTACATPVAPTSDLPRGGWRVDSGAHAFRFPNLSDDGFVEHGTFANILGKIVPAEQVQVIRWPHPLVKDDGFSPISAGGALVETGEKVTESRWAQLTNGIDPSIVVMLGGDQDPSKEELEAAAEVLNQKYSGAENKRKAIVLPGGGSGASVTPLSASALDMDFATGFADYRTAILALQGTPPVAAGVQEAGAYAAYYASLRQFIDLTVQPILDVLAEEDTEKFLPQFGPGLTCEIEASPINDPDVLERQLQTDINAGIRTVDEVRTLRGLKPFGGARGSRIAGQPLPQTPSLSSPPLFPSPGFQQRGDI